MALSMRLHQVANPIQTILQKERRICLLQIIWFEHSYNAIDFGWSQVTVWSPRHHQGRVPSHQSQGQPLEELLDSNSLQHALVASYSDSNPLHLLCSHLVKAAQSLHGDWEEGDPLLLASLCSPLHLALKGLLQMYSD